MQSDHVINRGQATSYGRDNRFFVSIHNRLLSNAYVLYLQLFDPVILYFFEKSEILNQVGL
jgi:hypothetical protein